MAATEARAGSDSSSGLPGITLQRVRKLAKEIMIYECHPLGLAEQEPQPRVSLDACFLLARATEELLASLATAAAANASLKAASTISYDDVVHAVHQGVGYGFLKEVVPKQVKVKDIMELAKQMKADKVKKQATTGNLSNKAEQPKAPNREPLVDLQLDQSQPDPAGQYCVPVQPLHQPQVLMDKPQQSRGTDLTPVQISTADCQVPFPT